MRKNCRIGAHSLELRECWRDDLCEGKETGVEKRRGEVDGHDRDGEGIVKLAKW